MRKRTLVATLGAAGALALTGIGVAVADPSPAPTPAPSTADTDEGGSRRDAIANALGGLVGNGTITQEQADAVATALEDADVGRGWEHGGHQGWDGAWQAGVESAAATLGMTTEELRDALSQEGTSLADVAAQQGVATQDLVDALTTAARERIDQAVAEGRLSREEADEILADLPDRVADAVAEDSWSGRWWRHHDSGD